MTESGSQTSETPSQTSAPVAHGIAHLLSSQAVLQATGFVRGLIVAGILGPQLFGVWKMVQVFLRYFTNVHLGLISASAREIPKAYGRGDSRRYAEIVSTVFTATLLLAGGFLGIFALVVLVSSALRVYFWPSVLALFALAVVLDNWTRLVATILLATRRTKTLSALQMVHALVENILGILLILWLKVEGALLSFILAQAGYFWPRSVRGVLRFTRPEYRKCRDLAAIGFPITLNSFVSGVFVSLPLLAVGALFAPREVGLFGFALGMFMPVLALAQATDQVVMPEMARRVGAHAGGDESLAFIGPDLQRYTTWLLVGCGLIGIGVVVLSPVVVRLLLPAYLGALPLIPIINVSIMVYYLRTIGGSLLNVTDAQRRYLAITSGATALHAILLGAAAWAERSPSAMAWAGVGANGVLFLAVLWAALRRVDCPRGEALRFLVRLVAAVVTLTVVLGLLAYRGLTIPASVPGALAEAMLLSVAWIGLAHLLFAQVVNRASLAGLAGLWTAKR